ncbi:MAG: energy-coupling factor ABC transporter substrate-binding protein [Eubacteriales bacterium]|nr:energy-coupling factor ABC transporter substrate-binding protein [Pseudomonadota bacterium]MBU4532574.1 energy-coupling factor ABC transporter substrate-binding protein [Bacillota bacterium]MBV1728519.1 energy-coupling factor ABC transporter substrate-binding protein [Desulforudis sp.]MDQ7789363.1 energy-coupling factor ABC transporter substrate-binding protein [Clostridia bacterium]MDZ4042590.1 energy-coupling factor ABC transporter substrate-binding protein [Eubacteriales bacterium]
MKLLHANLLLILGVILLAALPLFLVSGSGDPDAELFTGADEQAQALIAEIRPDYEPWAEPFWEPPSGEVESLLFALQAALGAGFIGYYFGRKRGASR